MGAAKLSTDRSAFGEWVFSYKKKYGLLLSLVKLCLQLATCLIDYEKRDKFSTM